MEELSLSSKPKISLTKVNISFDELNKRHFTQLIGTESQNTSQIVISNYDEVFEKVNKTPKTNTEKPYKCDIKGCSFATAFPFSLDQHKVRHQLAIDAKTESSVSKKKGQSFSLLNGMNNYVYNYMKSKGPNEDKNGAHNMSVPSSQSEYSSDCPLNEPNICIEETNEQNINTDIDNKIVSKIKDLLNNKFF